MIGNIFNIILYQPLYNLLIFFYNVIPGHDIGVSIIALTVLLRLALYPFSVSALKSQKSLQKLQPKLDALKEKYKNDKDAQAKEMMKLYQDEKVNPFSSCLPVLIQLPIFIAVYQVFKSGLASSGFNMLYPFVANPGIIKPLSIGFLDLSVPSIILALLAGAAQYWQMRMLLVPRPDKGLRKDGGKDEDTMAMVNKQMSYTMPAFTVILGIKLPAGLTLYWLVTTLISVLQQWIVLRNKEPIAATAGVSLSGAPVVAEIPAILSAPSAPSAPGTPSATTPTPDKK